MIVLVKGHRADKCMNEPSCLLFLEDGVASSNQHAAGGSKCPIYQRTLQECEGLSSILGFFCRLEVFKLYAYSSHLFVVIPIVACVFWHLSIERKKNTEKWKCAIFSVRCISINDVRHARAIPPPLEKINSLGQDNQYVLGPAISASTLLPSPLLQRHFKSGNFTVLQNNNKTYLLKCLNRILYHIRSETFQRYFHIYHAYKDWTSFGIHLYLKKLKIENLNIFLNSQLRCIPTYASLVIFVIRVHKAHFTFTTKWARIIKAMTVFAKPRVQGTFVYIGARSTVAPEARITNALFTRQVQIIVLPHPLVLFSLLL